MSEGNGDERASEPAALVAAVLDEESRRQGEARDDLAVDVALAPGCRWRRGSAPVRARPAATARCCSPSARCGASASRSSR